MGHHAKVAMDEVQIQVYPGLSGNTDQIVDEFIKGKLILDESAIHECKH